MLFNGGGQWPWCVARDRIEGIYKQDSGVFALPKWLMSVLVSQQIAKEDHTWREIQAQWSMHGLAVSHSLMKLEAALNTALLQAEESSAKALDCLVTLKDEVNDNMTTPLHHALRMARGYFNNVSSHCKQITKVIHDL